MLPKSHRLSKTADIAAVARGGKRMQQDGLLLRAKQNGLGVTRFAVIVGKKTEKRATQRNRMRRMVREALQANLDKMLPGWDVLCIIVPGFEAETTQEAEAILAPLLKKSKILSD